MAVVTRGSILALLLLASAAAGIELQRVAVSPPLPLGQHPVPCDNRVYFTASPPANPLQFVLYAAESESEPEVPIVDDTVGIPGTMAMFAGASDPDCAPDGVTFLGSNIGVAGAFLYDREGDVHPLLLSRIELDGLLLGIISGLNTNPRSGDLAAVAGLVEVGVRTARGVVFKPSDGDPVLVSDFRTILPGESAPADTHHDAVPLGGGVAFVGQTNFDRIGVYWWHPSSGITLVANVDTQVPGLAERFTGFFSTIGWDDRLVFSGFFPSGGGLFQVRTLGGPVEPMVMPGDVTADGEVLATVYANPGGPSRGEGRLLVFTGFTQGSSRYAAFVRTPSGEIRRLLRVGDVIDGETVEDIGTVGASPFAVAIEVDYIGPERAIYRADIAGSAQVSEIPTLSGLGLLGSALLVALLGVAFLHRRAQLS